MDAQREKMPDFTCSSPGASSLLPPHPHKLKRLLMDKRERILPERSRKHNFWRHVNGADCKVLAVIMTKFCSNRSKKQTTGS